MANVYQVTLEVIEEDGSRHPPEDRDFAEAVSEQLGWTLEDGFPDDPAFGIWHCSIPSTDEVELEFDGYLQMEMDTEDGWIALGEIDLP